MKPSWIALEGAMGITAQSLYQKALKKTGLKRLAGGLAPAYIASFGMGVAKDSFQLAQSRISPGEFRSRLLRKSIKGCAGLGAAELGALCGTPIGPAGMAVGALVGGLIGEALIDKYWSPS